MQNSFVFSLFRDRPLGTFEDGYVFGIAPDMEGAEDETDAGYWRCDITQGEKLTWSDQVYAMFGVGVGTTVSRDWAVDRYTEPSKSTLERVRTYALRRKLGFIIDAAIRADFGGHRWIRVLAVPIISNRSGRVVGLHGLKRSF